MLTDTHAHLYDQRFEKDLDDVVQRAEEARVKKILLPAVYVLYVHKALEFCE